MRREECVENGVFRFERRHALKGEICIPGTVSGSVRMLRKEHSSDMVDYFLLCG